MNRFLSRAPNLFSSLRTIHGDRNGGGSPLSSLLHLAFFLPPSSPRPKQGEDGGRKHAAALAESLAESSARRAGGPRCLLAAVSGRKCFLTRFYSCPTLSQGSGHMMLDSLESDSALCEADPSVGRSSVEKPAGGSVASTSAKAALDSAS